MKGRLESWWIRMVGMTVSFSPNIILTSYKQSFYTQNRFYVMIRHFILLFSVVIALPLSAQFDFEKAENELAFYADVMVNAMEPAHREKAYNEFNTQFEEVLKKDGAFDYGFDKLKWVSFVSDPEESFRFISWQLSGLDDSFDYKTFYQSEDKLMELENTMSFGRNVEYASMDNTNWYGRLIYDIQPIDDYFLIFGFRQLDQYTKTKVVEILKMKDGHPEFGEAVFGKGDSKYAEAKSRVMIQYSADALANLNFNPGLNMLVFDHMVSRMGNIPGQGPTHLPDGTYEAFKLENGKWQYVEQLHTELQIEKPKEGSRKEEKDILGRSKH